MKRILAAGILGLTTLAAQAETEDAGWQMGVAVLFGDYSLQGNAIDDNAVGAKISGQYRFNRYFGIEGSWLNTGDFDTDAISDNAGTVASVGIDGFQLSAIGYLPWSPENFDIYGKLGFYTLDQTLESTTGDSQRNADGFTAGLGFGVDITERFTVRLDYDWYNMSDDADFWAVSLGGYFNFGH